MPSVKRKRSSSSSKRVKRSRKSYTRRRAPIRGMRTSIQTHSFHRWVTAMPSGSVGVTNCTYNTGTSVLAGTLNQETYEFSLQFPFNAIPNPSEFGSLFDAYKITGVLLTIKMINNPDAGQSLNSTTPANALNFYPSIWYTADHDDAGTVSLAQIKEFEKVRHKVLRPNQEVKIMLRPTTLTQTYRTALTTGYQVNKRSVWLDMAQQDIPHYGFKSVIDMEGLVANNTQAYYFKVNAKYYFKCRMAR